MIAVSRAVDAANPLSVPEKRALEKHEATIERGAKTFVEVGAALMAIQEQRLYRDEYPTFETYCRDRWGLSRQYAYQQIQAAKVSAIADSVPNEAVARELAPLLDKPKLLKATWDKAVEHSAGELPTAKEVQAEVAKVAPKPKARAPEPAAPDEYQLSVDDVMAQWKHYRDQIGQLVDDTAALKLLTPSDRSLLWKSCVEPMVRFLNTLRTGDGT